MNNPEQRNPLADGIRDAKPCPFCGGKPDIYKKYKEITIFCKSCPCRMTQKYHHQGPEKLISKLCESWNVRTEREKEEANIK